MLHGPRVVLRSRIESDTEVLHAELFDDVVEWSRANGRAWRPLPLGAASPFGPSEPSEEVARFSVVARDDDALLGAALLWGIDAHNRLAHIGMSLRPFCRGLGYGTEVVQVLCRYGFETLGLHRLAIETLEDNLAMLGAARAAGFRTEGAIRSAAWVDGAFHNELVLGLLAAEWRDARPAT